MSITGFNNFIKQAFSDNGAPSSARLLTAFTVLTSAIGLLHVCFASNHLPDGMALTGLGTYAVSPYAIHRASKMFGKDAGNGSAVIPSPLGLSVNP